MHSLEFVLWLCAGSIAFHYLGYPLLLFIFSVFFQAKADFTYLIRRVNRRCATRTDYVPQVAILMSVYNEESVIRAKVKNLLEINYPFDRLEFLLGLDAPVDSTSKLLSESASCFPLPDPARKIGGVVRLGRAHLSGNLGVYRRQYDA